MKSMVCSMFAVIALTLGWTSTAQAQNVAIVDLKKIFDGHARFKMMTEELKREVDAAEADVKARQEQINKMIKSLSQWKVDSPEYLQVDETITKMKGDLSVLATNHKKDFARKEARIYHTVFQEVMKEIEYFCTQNRIDLVLRYNSELMETDDSTDPGSVAKQLNKIVVYSNSRIDITEIVLNRLGKAAPAAGAPNVGARPGVPARPGIR